MTIRPATEGDLDEILALVQELADYEREPAAMVADRDEFAHHLFGPDAVVRGLIAEHDGAVAGMALYYRRHGYGRALLDALRARTDGRVEWAVLDWNASAQEFYRSLGAAPVDGWSIWRWPPVASSG